VIHLCPTPEKSIYRTLREAKAAALASQLRLRAYCCDCGAYHLTRKEHRGDR
jgi:hypothetical protein